MLHTVVPPTKPQESILVSSLVSNNRVSMVEVEGHVDQIDTPPGKTDSLMQCFIFVNVCLLLFYVLAAFNVISGWVVTCDCAYSWQLYSAAYWETRPFTP